MFTDCPACGRQFHVRAWHLSAAGGQVRCGYCGRQFDALERLRDRPAPQPAKSELPELHAERPAPQPVKSEFPEPHAERPATQPVKTELPEPEFDLPPEAVPASASKARPVPRAGKPPRPGKPFLPPALGPEPGPPGGARRAAWGLAFLVLLLLAAGQVAWFHRDTVLAHYPALAPWLEKLCARLHCEVLELRDLSAIHVVNRDVRLHPLYEQSLLVNATIANSAPMPQPFPAVQIVLFDTEGGVVAARNFKPSEYLDSSMDLERGMEPGVPVHFVLEVTGATEGAVSFELGFL